MTDLHISDPVPLPKQYIAATSPARQNFYAGAAGPGKSWFFAMLGKQGALRAPGSYQVFFRRVSKDLDLYLPKIKQLIPTTGPDRISRFNNDKTIKKFSFLNGSTFDFTHLAHLNHIQNHLSAEYDRIFFDEASTFMPEQLTTLSTRLRTTVQKTRQMGGEKEYLGSNPGGVAHLYLLNNFVMPDPDYVMRVVAYYPIEEAMELWEKIKKKHRIEPGADPTDIRNASKAWIKKVREIGLTWRAYDEKTMYEKKEVDPYDVWTAYPNEVMLEHGIRETHTRVFVPAFLEDNPYIGKEYAQQLAQNHDEKTARAYLDGDWMSFEGQFFKEFSPRRYNEQTGEWEDWHVIPPTVPEPWRPKVAAMDWGFSDRAMCVIGWFYYDPNRDEWVMWQEFAQNRMIDSEIARRYTFLTGGYQVEFVSGDQSMFHDADSKYGKSRGEFFQDAGMPLAPASRDRIAGWRAVRELLAVNPRTGKPKLRICSNCTYTIKTLPGLVHDEKNTEDLNTEGDDHAADMLRYFAIRSQGVGSGSIVDEDYSPGIGRYTPIATGPPEEPGRRWVEVPGFLFGDEPAPWDEGK